MSLHIARVTIEYFMSQAEHLVSVRTDVMPSSVRGEIKPEELQELYGADQLVPSITLLPWTDIMWTSVVCLY